MTRYVKSGTVNTVQEINSELEKIAEAQEDFLARDGETPNSMKGTLDMDSNRITNLPAPASPSDPVRSIDLPNFITEDNNLLLITREERKVLSAGQVSVTFSDLTTTQTAYYISGSSVDQGRLIPNIDYTVTSTTSITLTDSYPEGTSLTAVQNEGVEALISDIQTFDNIAIMKDASLGVGDTAMCKRYYADGDLVDGLLFNIVAGSTGTDEGGAFHNLSNGNQAQLIYSGEVSADVFGAVGDGVTDDSDAIQAAIDIFPVNLVGGGIVNLNPSKDYAHASSILVPSNITLNCRGGITRYTGTDKAFILGESLVALNYDCKLLNMVCVLEDKSSVGVYLRNTAGAEVTGYMEGGYKPYDNTRTNVGVWIDGGNVSSFFNRFELRLNHIHEGYRLKTTGNRQSTQHMFDNCSILADQDTDDLSIGYNIGPSDNGAVQEGQGTVINGGNIEKCQTGFIHGPKAGRFTLIGVRTEIVIGGSAWKFKIEAGAEPLTLIGINGLGTTYMESASGITGWANNSGNTLIGGDAGELRLGGFDTPVNGDNQFIGIGSDNPQFRILGDADFDFLADSDATGAGRAIHQIGRGSATHGGGIAYHGGAHPTYAGQSHVFGATNRGVQFTNGLYGATHGEIRNTAIAGTTALWLWDVDNGALEQVTVGAADSGGSGFKVLRIPN